MNDQKRIHFQGGKRESPLLAVPTSPWMMALLLSGFGEAGISVFAQTEDEEQISEMHRREILGEDDGWMNWVGETYVPGVLLVIGVALLVIFLVRGRPLV
jgi:hypothetical protein